MLEVFLYEVFGYRMCKMYSLNGCMQVLEVFVHVVLEYSGVKGCWIIRVLEVFVVGIFGCRMDGCLDAWGCLDTENHTCGYLNMKSPEVWWKWIYLGICCWSICV